MKEINDIVKAYNEAVKEGRKCALATVVKVEGSSYRQPGARMLVTEDGQLTGAISGGCLEGDALKRALLSIHQKENKLITYNTNNEEDAEVGLQLGCNGIVHILFEFIDDEKTNNPITFLEQLGKERKPAVLVTLFSLKKYAIQLGTVLFYRENEFLYQNEIALKLLSDAKEVLYNKTSIIKNINSENTEEALIEYVNPPISLVIAGAGNDVQPLVKMTSILGWEVSIIDGRSTHAVSKRFPDAKNVTAAKSDAFLENVTIDSQTYFVLMTHNYQYDLEVLRQLLEQNCHYIGVLGPKTKLNRMLDDLKQKGIEVNEEQLKQIYGPIGLDLGAETAEEIALSIVAEIKAVISGTNGSSLKNKSGKIHTTTIHV